MNDMRLPRVTNLEAVDQLRGLPAETQQVVKAVMNRRSARAGEGFEMPGGAANPLAYKSPLKPTPLTLQEEAVIAMSAVGITGIANAELPLHKGPDGNGNVLVNMVARAIPSADATHSVSLVVINDEGAWFIKRPQNMSEAELKEVLALKDQGRIVDMYEKMRVKITDKRPAVGRDPFNTPNFNLWDHNRPGSTVFLPIIDVSTMIIAATLSGFNKDTCFNVLDQYANYAVAGTKEFGDSRGGWLSDDPKAGRQFPMFASEKLMNDLCAVESGAAIANMALVGSTLSAAGIGGFPHSAATPGWFAALGFTHTATPQHKLPGLRGIKKLFARIARGTIPIATKLESNGQPLVVPFTPENFPSEAGKLSMDGAVRAFLRFRFGEHGTMRDGIGPWKDNAALKSAITPPDEDVVQATIAACSYIYDRYGKFPAQTGPLATIACYQAHHIDPGFYAGKYAKSPTA